MNTLFFLVSFVHNVNIYYFLFSLLLLAKILLKPKNNFGILIQGFLSAIFTFETCSIVKNNDGRYFYNTSRIKLEKIKQRANVLLLYKDLLFVTKIINRASHGHRKKSLPLNISFSLSTFFYPSSFQFTMDISMTHIIKDVFTTCEYSMH